MAMYGKTLGNGYAITAVVGKKSIMEAAQKTFISSTFWTERIGPTAALKTLEIMERERSWEQITSLGIYMRKKWKSISKKYGINIDIYGLPSISSFKFLHPDNNKFKTFLTQNFEKRLSSGDKFLFINSHTEEIIDNYSEILDEIFYKIKKCIEGLDNIQDLLESDESHVGFKRLN